MPELPSIIISMRIGLDLDSVLADIMSSLLEFHNKKYGTNTKPENQTEYYLGKLWGCDMEEAIRRVHEFYFSPEFEKIPVVKGALEGVNKLSKEHSLHIITSRPHIINNKTNRWIQKHFQNKIRSVHHTNQVSSKRSPKKLKSEICRELKLEVFVEDHVEYAADVASLGIKVFLLTTRWNKSKKTSFRGYSSCFMEKAD